MKISKLNYDAIMVYNTEMSLRMEMIRKKVNNEYIRCYKKGYQGSLYCEEIADILGFTLPVIEKEEKKEEIDEGHQE